MRKWLAMSVWALVVASEGSKYPAIRELIAPTGPNVPGRPRGRGGLSELRVVGAHGRQLDHERALKIVLYGQVVLVSHWDCLDECSPEHEDQAENFTSNETPAFLPESSCTERRQTGSLKLEDEIDLKCTGSNLTCDDIENNPKWKNWKTVLYSNCNQDEDMLHGECELHCVHGIYPRKKCTIQYDRVNKYGMHGSGGQYDFHTCVLLSVCHHNESTEQKQLYCNVTEMHNDFSKADTTVQSTTTTVAAGALPNATTSLLVKQIAAEKSKGEDGTSPVVAALLGVAAMGLFVVISLVVYCKLCKKPNMPAQSNTFSEQGVLGHDAGSTVVVGRPVAGVAPPAGEIANAPIGHAAEGEKSGKETAV